MFDELRIRSAGSGQNQPPRHKLAKVAALAVLFVIPLLIFVMLANAVRGNAPLPGDVPVLQAINTLASPALDLIMVGITLLGDAEIVVPALLVVAAVLYLRARRRKEAAFLVLAAGGTSAINLVFKHIFQRDRPTLWEHLVNETSFSFPSGHAMISSTIALTVIILCWKTRYRRTAITLGILYCFLISFSRLYLGVHFPSDILAGWCVSAVWVLTVYIIFRNFNLFPENPTFRPETAPKAKLSK